MRIASVGIVLLVMMGAAGECADHVIDVHQQWQDHASSAPVTVQNSAPTPPVIASTETLPSDCGCSPMTVAEKLSQTTCAFTGTVEEISPAKNGQAKAVFDVDEVFKGSPKEDMDIFTAMEGTPCDISFAEGKKYLVYSQWEWGHYVTSRCMGTQVIERARGDASSLGLSEATKEKLYIQLRNACMGRDDTMCCLASLKAMRAGYNIPEPDDGCPSGTKPDRLRCGGSYTWCIPVTEEDHRPLGH